MIKLFSVVCKIFNDPKTAFAIRIQQKGTKTLSVSMFSDQWRAEGLGCLGPTRFLDAPPMK